MTHSDPIEPPPIPIIIVTEGVKHPNGVPIKKSRELEKTTPEDAEEIVGVFSGQNRTIRLVNCLHEFEALAPNLKNSIVIPHWNGSGSRNRTAYASTISELHNLVYLGPDSFVRLMANDKSLSKRYLTDCGFETPNSVFIGIPKQWSFIKNLNPPLIVKPNNEGSSIGIDRNSLVDTFSDAKALILERIKQFPQGLIVEEYIQGREVFLSGALDKYNNLHWASAERYVIDDPDLIANYIYDAELKFFPDQALALRKFDIFDKSIISKTKCLIDTLKTVDIIRLDGRVRDGTFYVIEITPDPFLTRYSEFFGSFEANGFPPKFVADLIIDRLALRLLHR